jgi:hypothetical protein
MRRVRNSNAVDQDGPKRDQSSWRRHQLLRAPVAADANQDNRQQTYSTSSSITTHSKLRVKNKENDEHDPAGNSDTILDVYNMIFGSLPATSHQRASEEDKTEQEHDQDITHDETLSTEIEVPSVKATNVATSIQLHAPKKVTAAADTEEKPVVTSHLQHQPITRHPSLEVYNMIFGQLNESPQLEGQNRECETEIVPMGQYVAQRSLERRIAVKNNSEIRPQLKTESNPVIRRRGHKRTRSFVQRKRGKHAGRVDDEHDLDNDCEDDEDIVSVEEELSVNEENGGPSDYDERNEQYEVMSTGLSSVYATPGRLETEGMSLQERKLDQLDDAFTEPTRMVKSWSPGKDLDVTMLAYFQSVKDSGNEIVTLKDVTAHARKVGCALFGSLRGPVVSEQWLRSFKARHVPVCGTKISANTNRPNRNHDEDSPRNNTVSSSGAAQPLMASNLGWLMHMLAMNMASLNTCMEMHPQSESPPSIIMQHQMHQMMHRTQYMQGIVEHMWSMMSQRSSSNTTDPQINQMMRAMHPANMSIYGGLPRPDGMYSPPMGTAQLSAHNPNWQPPVNRP